MDSLKNILGDLSSTQGVLFAILAVVALICIVVVILLLKLLFRRQDSDGRQSSKADRKQAKAKAKARKAEEKRNKRKSKQKGSKKESKNDRSEESDGHKSASGESAPAALLQRANMHMAAGDYDKAEQVFLAINKHRPSDMDAVRSLLSIYGERKDVEKFSYTYESAMRLLQNSSDTLGEQNQLESIKTQFFNPNPDGEYAEPPKVAADLGVNFDQLGEPDFADMDVLGNPESMTINESVTSSFSGMEQLSAPSFADTNELIEPNFADMAELAEPNFSEMQDLPEPDFADMADLAEPVFANTQAVSEPDFANIGGLSEPVFEAETKVATQAQAQINEPQTNQSQAKPAASKPQGAKPRYEQTLIDRFQNKDFNATVLLLTMYGNRQDQASFYEVYPVALQQSQDSNNSSAELAQLEQLKDRYFSHVIAEPDLSSAPELLAETDLAVDVPEDMDMLDMSEPGDIDIASDISAPSFDTGAEEPDFLNVSEPQAEDLSLASSDGSAEEEKLFADFDMLMDNEAIMADFSVDAVESEPSNVVSASVAPVSSIDISAEVDETILRREINHDDPAEELAYLNETRIEFAESMLRADNQLAAMQLFEKVLESGDETHSESVKLRIVEMLAA